LRVRNVRIPKDKHGLVIGKKGANIARIKETYGVSINVPDQSDPTDIIVLRGTSKEALDEAKYDLLQLLQKDGRGGAGRGRGRGSNRDFREGGNRESGGNRDFREGGGNREFREGGGNREFREGGGNREFREGGGRYNRGYGKDNDQESKSARSKQPKPPQKINLNDANEWPAFG